MSTPLEAIVLKSFDYQDHHKIVKLISPSHGLISVFIGYANKKKSRYRALSEPLSCVNMTVKAPNDERGGLYYLVHGEIVDPFYELKLEYEKIMMFYEMAEVVLKGDIDLQHLPHSYRLLKSVLEEGEMDDVKFRLAIVYFKFKMLSLLGVAPVVDDCVSCGTTASIVTASIREGGLVCKECYTREEILITSELIPLWRVMFKVDLKRLLEAPVSLSEIETLETWIKVYYESYTAIKFTERI